MRGLETACCFPNASSRDWRFRHLHDVLLRLQLAEPCLPHISLFGSAPCGPLHSLDFGRTSWRTHRQVWTFTRHREKKYQLSNNGIRRSRNTFMYINRWYYFDERHHQLVPVHQQAQGYRVQGVHGLPCHFNLPAVWERVLDVQDVHGWSRDG